MNKCQVKGCAGKYYAKLHCNKHYLQMRIHGKIQPTKYDKRPHIIKDSYAMIELGIRGKQGHALVDIEDAWVDKYFWQKHHGYATGLVEGKFDAMARLIMQPPEGMVVDHISGDKLDNRRSNLRICTQAENNRNQPVPAKNTTGYKGVVRADSKVNPYQAQIKVNRNHYYLGVFKTAKEAAEAYDKAAKELHGEFAKPNSLILQTETG